MRQWLVMTRMHFAHSTREVCDNLLVGRHFLLSHASTGQERASGAECTSRSPICSYSVVGQSVNVHPGSAGDLKVGLFMVG